jgi:hypothetical protein
MAVNKAVIESDLNSLYVDCTTGGGLTKEQFADRMATIIKDAILSADVNTNLTPGTATATDPISGALPVVGGSSTGGLT